MVVGWWVHRLAGTQFFKGTVRSSANSHNCFLLLGNNQSGMPDDKIKITIKKEGRIDPRPWDVDEV